MGRNKVTPMTVNNARKFVSHSGKVQEFTSRLIPSHSVTVSTCNHHRHHRKRESAEAHTCSWVLPPGSHTSHSPRGQQSELGRRPLSTSSALEEENDTRLDGHRILFLLQLSCVPSFLLPSRIKFLRKPSTVMGTPLFWCFLSAIALVASWISHWQAQNISYINQDSCYK